MKSYFMDELHGVNTEIVICQNKTKDLDLVDVEVDKLQDKIEYLFYIGAYQLEAY